MTVRMRHTRSHTGNRRSHHALTGGGLTACSHCGYKIRSHTACANCGKYQGRQEVDVMKKLTKKEKKQKAKELAAEEATAQKPLDAASLSKK